MWEQWVHLRMTRKNVAFKIRLSAELRGAFAEACRAEHRPAAQVVRELMREYIASVGADSDRAGTLATGDNLADIQRLLQVLAHRDTLEAARYRDIVRSRLKAIRDLQGLVDADVVERVLQRYLFDHLWLLDAAWERATGSEQIESCLREVGVITDDLTEKEKLGRVDIAYRTNAGKHIIVELKRAGRQPKLLELVEQGQTYVDKLREILLNQGDMSPDIEVVFVLGRPIQEQADNPERLKASMASVSPGSRITCYDILIRGARGAYSEYLEASKELGPPRPPGRET